MKRGNSSNYNFMAGAVAKIVKPWFGGILGGAMVLMASGAESPRAARSVHLQFAAPAGNLFYNEVTVEQSTKGSYFMACGWSGGYFGMQQLDASTNKVVIFSVWDTSRGDDANKVPLEQRVQILYQDGGVTVSRFGGEGTGGKCLWPYLWGTNETCRFAVMAVVEHDRINYSGWVFDRYAGKWLHLVTFSIHKSEQPLRGLYSFIEDFRRDGQSVNETRRARFGNGWLRTLDGKWVPLNRATFTASNAEWESKDNIDAGTSGNAFYLATGGDIMRTRELNHRIDLNSMSTNNPPDLPDLLKP
jgi:Domain of unknown function (DUF3472)/Domain of unknown function (DUF5077)